MPELFLPLSTGMVYSLDIVRTNSHFPPRRSPITNGTNRHSLGSEVIRHLSISSVFLVGLGLGSLWGLSTPASATISRPTSSVTHLQEEDGNAGNSEAVFDFEDETVKEEFERWKSKSYALTVPLRVVALQGSLPPIWIREFMQSQGKRVRFSTEFRQSLADIYRELSYPFRKGKLNPKSAAVADVVTLGDSWINFAIANEFIVSIEGGEDQHWFQQLSHEWKVYLRRSSDGRLDPRGKIWAVPYRWGSMVIAYNKKEFQRRKLAPVKVLVDL
ncbi:hypothetical protein M569_09636 [Genlisea aurea]|uniref:Uncharacterized protein n=1 Tax=Genlisea aurea TaxID=192259 RepID=S8DPW0_9LAMI|nr:hypothetical protein M569_09636 [Genlisea aurea]